MHRGYIKLWRKIADNELWTAEPFSRGQAFVDLVLIANHKDGFFRCRGIKVPVKRGQVGMSEGSLAERWKWSRGKVRRFLAEQQTEQQIVQQKSNVLSVMTIVNYELYQGDDTADDTANGTANGQQIVQQTDTNKNVKNVKKEEEPLYPRGNQRELFKETKKEKQDRAKIARELYDLYPKHVEPKAAIRAIVKALGVETEETLREAVTAYAEAVADQDKQFIPYPATWFNKERWKDDRSEWSNDGKTADDKPDLFKGWREDDV